METELKFAISAEARGKIEQHALPLSVQRGSTHTDHTTYFDTPDRALRRAGFSLRIRHRLGHDSYIQTVKSAGNGTYRRQEWEWPVGSEHLELERFSEVPELKLFRDGAKTTFNPLFRTEVRRTQIVLTPTAGSQIELALDDGAVVAGNKREPLSELELELKEGAEKVLFRLGLEFLQVAPLALLNESKAERGYHLLDGTRPTARKPGPIELRPDLTLYEGFRHLAATVLDSLLANHPAALRGEEQEGIHQMRIGVRRLRSLLVLFDRFLEPHVSNRFQDELQRLGQVLGAARDWDVVLHETLPRALKGANADWIEPWRALALERQHSAHQAAKNAILEPAFTNFVLAFQAWIRSADSAVPHRLSDRPLVDAAPDMLSRLARKVNKRLAAIDTSNPINLHSLRKSAKKLRYAIEFFEGLYGEKAQRYHRRCNELQKRLGDLNDLTTLTRLAEELTQGRRIDLAPALGMLANRSEALVRKELKGLDRVFAKFEREEPFWR